MEFGKPIVIHFVVDRGILIAAAYRTQDVRDLRADLSHSMTVPRGTREFATTMAAT